MYKFRHTSTNNFVFCAFIKFGFCVITIARMRAIILMRHVCFNKYSRFRINKKIVSLFVLYYFLDDGLSFSSVILVYRYS